jgi:hypothetical protein
VCVCTCYLQIVSLNLKNRIGGIMVRLFVSSAIDCVFEPRSGQTKDYKIGICCFSVKHVTLRGKSENSDRNHDNLSKISKCRRTVVSGRVMVMVFNATFNNISVISLRSVWLVEETGVSGENHRPSASHWQTLSHNVVSSTPRLSWMPTPNVSGDRHWLHM